MMSSAVNHYDVISCNPLWYHKL